MPVRLLTSSVLRWPDAATVDAAARRWAERAARKHPGVLRIGCFGSYARGDWGPGSDLDLIAVVDHAAAPFAARPATWDATDLPVPADVLIYTHEEWDSAEWPGRFRDTVMREVVWVWTKAA